MYAKIDLDGLKRQIDAALDCGKFKIADALIETHDLISALTLPDEAEVNRMKSTAVFNRAKSARSSKGFKIGYTSPKVVKWDDKLDKLLVSTLVGTGAEFDVFMAQCGIDGITHSAIRSRIYKLGYVRPDKIWIKKEGK